MLVVRLFGLSVDGESIAESSTEVRMTRERTVLDFGRPRFLDAG